MPALALPPADRCPVVGRDERAALGGAGVCSMGVAGEKRSGDALG